MRYKFRGISRYSGEWVFGNVIEGKKTFILTDTGAEDIIVSNHCAASSGFVEVLKSSVGMCSNVFDINSVEVCVGDYVKIKDCEEFIGVVMFGTYDVVGGLSGKSVGFYIEWFDSSGVFCKGRPNSLMAYKKFLVVSGNIYQNSCKILEE